MNYVYSLAVITAAAGMIEFTVTNEKFGRYVRLISALCILSALISPLTSLKGLASLPDLNSDTETGSYTWDESELLAKIKENIESSIVSAVGAKFGIRSISANAECSRSPSGEFVIDKVVITFRNRAEWYRSADVKKYIKELIQAETEVRLDDR